jgi:nicotinic acid phosphoribosyltransferase
MAHNGYLAIRGDSGDPVEIMAGKKIEFYEPYDECEAKGLFVDEEFTHDWLLDYAWDSGIDSEKTIYFDFNGKFYEVKFKAVWGEERGGWTDCDYAFIDTYEIEWRECERTAQIMGLVWALDQIFGHTVNEKGYKVLPPYIKALYGDSITPQRCEEIYSRLAKQGYAINNVSLGVGSFSFMCLETYDNNGVHYNPYTRDTFGIAIKATYGQVNRKPVMIFKNPKELSWKKSQKGCVIVAKDGESYTDEHTLQEAHCVYAEENLLRPIFSNGEMEVEDTLAQIRNRMYPEGF